MSYKIKIPDNERYIWIQVEGDIKGETERKFARESIELARQKNIKNYLVDVRQAVNVARILEQYLFAYQDINEYEVPNDIKIAILKDSEDNSHNFIETVLKNAGYQCRIFIRKEDAVDYLIRRGRCLNT